MPMGWHAPGWALGFLALAAFVAGCVYADIRPGFFMAGVTLMLATSIWCFIAVVFRQVLLAPQTSGAFARPSLACIQRSERLQRQDPGEADDREVEQLPGPVLAARCGRPPRRPRRYRPPSRSTQDQGSEGFAQGQAPDAAFGPLAFRCHR